MEEIQEVEVKKQVLTEVTSVAKEEQKTGEKINLPSPEELRSKAAASFIKQTRTLAAVFPKLSSKQKNRVMMAILDMPTNDLPVMLKTDEEKLCFASGQRCISDRFLLTYYHIVEEQAKAKIAQAAKNVENSVDKEQKQE